MDEENKTIEVPKAPEKTETVKLEAAPAEPPKKSIHFPKLLLLALAFVILLIIVGGAYYLGKTNSVKPEENKTSQTTPTQKTTDETADWKTYISTCGFSAKYPKTWSADNLFFASDKDVCINIGDENFETGSGDAVNGFYLNIHKRKLDQTKFDSLEEYVKNYEMEGIPFEYNSKNYDNYSGFEFDPPGIGDNRSFMFLNDGYIYEVNWIISTSNKYNEIISNIISSINIDK